mmetsp:Transcript_10173/g.12695  ORF Transcript_10173/g.12695 Transcript_10173/m.12695 type:complete len:241 (-) Transcript_10173:269-991(-)|eukprot:CAMPEP_0204835982 /NCGR_PEP_ID=MMETSP1346-20131115/24186_1 /ASSEMBLY_ACC=CAM_ASM_000771 /TAXON_ID=215587 /ORGANISM="Aplanochytrium stocchinoi, Strain GSBS06" /LENGTH=240 /DNA_ID=CAMNT_0051970437 /DNA_START=58 /DNA_END=780 /DNA_ORIENTATION=-
MDFGGRVNSKPGSGGVLSGQAAGVARRERLRKLAMETIDLSKDPYFVRNHHGTYECKLCTTLHKTEGNYLAHTQGKRHQTNLGRRAAKDAKEGYIQPQSLAMQVQVKKNVIKIGRPGYKCFKTINSETGQKCLIFEVQYPEIEAGLQPRHRFMSAFEQKVEPKDDRYQYLLFAAEPYETIAFKIPNLPIDKSEGKFETKWDKEDKSFKLQLHFLKPEEAKIRNPDEKVRGKVKISAKMIY